MVPTVQGGKALCLLSDNSTKLAHRMSKLLHLLQHMDSRLKGRTKSMVPMEEGGKALCLLSDSSIELSYRMSESVASTATDGLET